jgi:Flp pilus assembly protein TadG
MLYRSRRSRSSRRHGAVLIESAVVYPVVFFFILATIIGGMGVFRYNEVSSMAREAARYASTHGGQYQKDNSNAIAAGTLPNVNDSYLTTNIIDAEAVSIDTTQLQISIQFNNHNGSFDWDDTANNGQRWPTSQTTINNQTYSLTNTVSVTVTYPWIPEMYLTGPINLTSTSVMPMSY